MLRPLVSFEPPEATIAALATAALRMGYVIVPVRR